MKLRALKEILYDSIEGASYICAEILDEEKITTRYISNTKDYEEFFSGYSDFDVEYICPSEFSDAIAIGVSK